MTDVVVVTRTRDRSQFLRRAILSVQAQSFESYAHVIVNDGGDPNAVDSVLDQTGASSDERVKIIHSSASTGMEAASNRGIRSVDSRFVALHDDDDSWHPDFLKLTIQELDLVMRDADAEVQGVVARTDKVREYITDTGIRRRDSTALFPRMKAISLFEQCTVRNQLTPISFVYSREAFNSIGGYDESLPVTGDWEFGIRFLLRYEVAYLDPGFALANYHQRPFTKERNDNSSFSGSDIHRVTTTKVINRYLRSELEGGNFGVGYLMGSLQHENDRLASLARAAIPDGFVKFFGRRWLSGS